MNGDQNYIRKMERMHKVFGNWEYKPNPNNNVTINVGALANLREATGWHLDMNEDRAWEVYCNNPTPHTYIVLRCKPFTTYYEVVHSFTIPANRVDQLLETFTPDNEDQWWVAIIVNADGTSAICDGNSSTGELSPDSRVANFFWHQPYDFSIRVSPKAR